MEMKLAVDGTLIGSACKSRLSTQARSRISSAVMS